MRLDLYLVQKDLARSRSHAQDIIKRGLVLVNGLKVLKPKYNVLETDQIKLSKSDDFVSRSANKLQGFLSHLKLNLKGRSALDVGASTGGFTEVLLQQEVAEVYCIDVGSNQLAKSLKNDPRVHDFEQIDAKKTLPFKKHFDLIVIDVSFTSSKLILLNILSHLKANADIILLFKPQFEGTRETRGKTFVVSESNSTLIKQDFEVWLQENSIVVKSSQKASLKGKKGNQEYVYWLKIKE